MTPSETFGWLAGRGVHPVFAEQVVKASLLLAIAWLLSMALKRASASSRHLLWIASLFAVFALPLLTLALPDWRIAPLLVNTAPVRGEAPSRALDDVPLAIAPENMAEPGSRSALQSSSESVGSDEPVGESGKDWILRIWAIGALLCASRVLFSTIGAERLAHRGTRLAEGTLRSEVAALCGALGIRSQVDLVESSTISMPMAWGLRRRTILLPRSARSWSADRLRVVLLHELAHLRRRDCETLILARLVVALHWFNPLAWIALARLQAEREHACDDLVLEAGTTGTEYAHHLLDIARNARSQVSSAWAMVGMARRSELEGRLLAILDPDLRRRSATRVAQLAVVGMMALVVVPLAALQPRQGVTIHYGNELGTLGKMPTELSGSLEGEASEPWARNRGEVETLATVEMSSRPTTSVQPVPQPEPQPMPSPRQVARKRPRPEPGTQTSGPRYAAESTRRLRVLEALTVGLGDEDSGLRSQAAHSLGMLGDSAAVPSLGNLLREDSSEAVRRQAAWALGMIEDVSAVPELRAAFSDSSDAVRDQVAWALGMIESDAAVGELSVALSDQNVSVRDRSAWALGMIGSEEGIEALVTAVDVDDEAAVRERAAWALGMIGGRRGVHSLATAVEADASAAVRDRAAWALGMIGDEDALDALLEAMKDDSSDVRHRALWAVSQISG